MPNTDQRNQKTILNKTEELKKHKGLWNRQKIQSPWVDELPTIYIFTIYDICVVEKRDIRTKKIRQRCRNPANQSQGDRGEFHN